MAADCALPGPNDHQAWDRLCFGRGGAPADAEQPAGPGPGSGGGGGGDEGGGGDSEAVPGSEITFLSPAILPTLMALDQVGGAGAAGAWVCAHARTAAAAVLTAGGGGMRGAAPPAHTPLSPPPARTPAPQVAVASLFLHQAQSLLDARPAGLPLARAQWLFALAARLEKPLHAELAAACRGLLRHCAALRAGAAGAGDPLLPRLNVMIAMAGAYFGQDESMVALIDSTELL
jgi:hypothetical protein